MIHTIPLDGQWLVRFSDYQRGRQQYANRDTIDRARYLPAQVPGEIHADLLAAGLIADPLIHANVLAARWVEEQIWSYRRTFTPPADALAASARAWLTFAGLDYGAEIVLNAVTVATHANAFLPLRVDITGKLRPGENVLAVHLDSGLYHATEKPASGYSHPGGKDSILHRRHWLRKPQSQFSWDWAPRLINVGIHGSVDLEYTADSVRLDTLVPLASVSDDLKTASVRVRLFAENLTTDPVEASLHATLHAPDGSIAHEASAPVTLKPGLHPVEVSLAHADPALWWPVGQGGQPLYKLSVALTTRAGTLTLPAKAIAFRHVAVMQDAHPVTGKYFRVQINHRDIFCKGGNFVPADIVLATVDRSRYETLIDRALEANFNLLRIWGGGQYETDDFYDLCDQRGILVWQDFIFACSRYPITDEHFQRTVKAEATHHIRRLAHHPSLIIWCGNNENEVMHWHWGPGEAGVIAPDYSLYHLTLPRIINSEDPTRYYQPSSPFSPDHRDPNDDTTGDQHPWAIGFFDTDFRKYRSMVCRFPNEGGILGPTALPTMRACMREDQQRVQSFDWQLHDNSVDSWEEPSPVDSMTQFHLGRDARSMTIEEYTYWAGLLQAEGLSEYINNFRRRQPSSAAAIFWMYNDTWPATRSWTIVDYYLRRTPSFYPVKRAFAPVHVVIAEEENAVIVFGINDTPAAVSATLRFGLFTLAGEYPLDRSAPAVLQPNAATELARFPKSQWSDPTTTLAFATLSQGPALLARNRLILPLFKELAWPKQQPDIAIATTDSTTTFTSKVFAFNVCLDLDGLPQPDNFFDLFPNQPFILPWAQAAPPKILHVGNPR